MDIFTVDAFTGKAFAGNPAAVCLLDASADVPWMRDVAAEMNLSETAFVSPRSDGGFDLRWFTPSVEVDLCGHATLASAHILWEIDRLPGDMEVRFHTRSGWLTCHRRTDRIEMDFPLRPVKEVDPPDGLIDALGVRPLAVCQSAVSYLVELESEQAVRDCAPDFVRLNEIPEGWTCITSVASTPGFDFVSRFFAPAGGIDEDPVTGSSHCALADYWSKRSGRSDFRAFQCSKRGGVVFARIVGHRVILGGQAVTVLRGELV
ncbi:MAG: PhzF family phenazine biosynthesis protein [Actinomycetota bacterium]